MCDKLVNIPFDDLQPLRDIYKKDWPRYYAGYSVIDNYRRWLQKDSNIPQLNIYSLNGDWSDGTYIVTDQHILYANTMTDNHARLVQALSLIDFANGKTIASVESRLIGTIYKFIETHGIKIRPISPTKYYYMPREEALKFVAEPPEGITFKSLSEDDAAIANDLWPFKHRDSEKFLRRLAKYNISVGAFTETGELVAWCFRLPVGCLGTLQVVEHFKRKGLGSVITKYMARAISETGDDVFSPVVIDNYPSRRLFDKLGFSIIDQMQWVLCMAGDFDPYEN